MPAPASWLSSRCCRRWAAASAAVVLSRRVRTGRCRRRVPRHLVGRGRGASRRPRRSSASMCPAGAAGRSADDRDGRELSAAPEGGARRRQPDRQARRRRADREHRRQRARRDSHRLARIDLSRVGGIDPDDDGDRRAVPRLRGRRRRQRRALERGARRRRLSSSRRGRGQAARRPAAVGDAPRHRAASDRPGRRRDRPVAAQGQRRARDRVRERHRPELDPVRRHSHRARRAAGVRPPRPRPRR